MSSVPFAIIYRKSINEASRISMKTYHLHPDSIRNLFDTVAPTYDYLNHLLSLRRDMYWRRMAVRELNGSEGWILDLATGTGDVAIEIVSQIGLEKKAFGLDFSEPMIRRALQKFQKRGLLNRAALSLGDALILPFRENTFAASMIAFGLRNIAEKEKALAEMVRVVKEGGKVIVLEFTLPKNRWIRKFYSIYFKAILPRIGGLVSGDRGAYTYLPESVSHFQHAGNYKKLLEEVGLKSVRSRPLTGGIASIISGTKDRG
jgi:demethylmenaquinone methyltransferase/2-methoxy-6-polyprenyl-1,4-benzoquinol methylase